MDEINLKIDKAGRGAFFIDNAGERVAEMDIMVKDSTLTVFHTEVADSLKGTGTASALLSKMVDYARGHNLKVIPLCPYVLAQFKRRPDQYADVWKKGSHS
jgi:predicted GNAT family acetyltransferase